MALAPDSVWVKEAAARQASRNGEKDDAVKLYREAIAVGTKNAVAYLVSAGMRLDEYSLGRTDFAGGGGASTDIAIKEIKQALELAPGNIEAYRLLGRAFYILPKLTEDRLTDLNPAMVSGADGCVVRFYRALLYQRLGKLPQCVNDLQTIINDPDALQRTKQGAQERLAAVEKKK
jgi:tetratricopeptide (TPR) repeat protein